MIISDCGSLDILMDFLRSVRAQEWQRTQTDMMANVYDVYIIYINIILLLKKQQTIFYTQR